MKTGKLSWKVRLVTVLLALLYVLTAVIFAPLLLDGSGRFLNVMAQVNDSLVLHYDFEREHVEGNTVRDVTGNGHDGTMVNASIAAGRNGMALDLQSFTGDPMASGDPANRVQSYAALPAGVLDGMTEVTVSAWVRFKYDAGNFWARVFDIGVGETAYLFVSKTNGAYYGYHGSEKILPSKPNAIFEDSVWLHVCVSVSPEKFSYYIGGELVGEIDQDVPPLSVLGGGAVGYIGKSQFAVDPCLSAYVDDFKIYNKYMTAEEVTEEMGNDMSTEAKLAADVAALDIGRTVGIANDLVLPQQGTYGTIAWQSSNHDVIGDDGKLGPNTGEDNTATLTATVTVDGQSAKKLFFVSVLRAGEAHFAIDIDPFDMLFDVSDTFSAGFFEDTITLDGGLYAELIENKSFEFENGLESFETVQREGGAGSVQIGTASPLNEVNTHYAKLVKTNAEGRFGLANDGFEWIDVKKGTVYDFSVFLRQTGGYAGTVSAVLENAEGKAISDTLTFSALTTDFEQYEGVLTATEDAKGAKLCLYLDGQGEVHADFLSLMPQSDFKGIKNIFNAELVQMIDALGFDALRFPGGCVIEGVSSDGKTLEKYNSWKDGIGRPEERKVVQNRWGGYQSNGVGYYEYFLLCEALGAEPIPVVNAGLSCQIDGGSGTASDHTYYCPKDELRETFVQDALDLIEYANGDETTYWGRKRIESGHEEPFGLKYLAIGNEQWGEEYFKRYAVFEEAIHEKYPEIVLVTTSGPSASGTNYDYAWEQINTWYRDNLVDEHYYMDTDWFLNNTDRYAEYDRDGAKVFVGEYSVKNADGKSTLYTALAEAAYISGMVKNADIVQMHSYAPLLSRADRSIWSPNLIVFDSSSAYGSAAYYTQLLYSGNTGNKVVSSSYYDNIHASDAYGGVSIGSKQTAFDIHNVTVTDRESGATLLDEQFTDVGKMLATWTFCNVYDSETSHFSWPNYHWLMETGVLRVMDKTGSADGGRPLADALDTRMIANNATGWKNYTLNTSITRTGGLQGVMLGFGYKDNDNYYLFHYGAENNSKIRLERITNGVSTVLAEVSATAPVMQNGVPYDFSIAFGEREIVCSVNGKTVIDYALVSPEKDLYYDVTFDTARSELIVKLVNTTSDALSVRLNFGTEAVLGQKARRFILTAPSKDSENSFEDPNCVNIKEDTYEGVSNLFDYVADPYSVTVLRIAVDGVKIGGEEEVVLHPGEETLAEAELGSGLSGVEWRSEDPNVATVDANGKITAVSEGQTRVFACANDGQFVDSIVVCVTAKGAQQAPSPEISADITESGFILHGPEGAEYSIDGGKTWQGGVFTGLEADTGYTIWIRMRETEELATSEAVSIQLRTSAVPAEKGADYGWYIGGGAAVLVVGLSAVAIVAVKRRKNNTKRGGGTQS